MEQLLHFWPLIVAVLMAAATWGGVSVKLKGAATKDDLTTAITTLQAGQLKAEDVKLLIDDSIQKLQIELLGKEAARLKEDLERERRHGIRRTEDRP